MKPRYKISIITSGIILIAIGTLYFTYEKPIDINEIESNQNISDHSMTFSAGNMTFHEDLCIKNDGTWVDYQYDSKCYFETYTKYEMAEIVFEETGKTKITGDVAKNVCIILDIPCPEDPKFNAWLDRDEGTTTFTYYKNKERFTFVIEDTEIKYRTDTLRNEWKVFGRK